jgi:hypothetical protein
MISENVTLLARAKSCQAECKISFGLSADGAKARKEGRDKLKLIEHWLMHLMNRMRFSWEQTAGARCLTERLSGNRRRLLAAPIPAPGGTQ